MEAQVAVMLCLIPALLFNAFPPAYCKEGKEGTEGENINLSFLSPHNGSCTFSLYFNCSVFDEDGMSVISPIYPNAKHSRTSVRSEYSFSNMTVRLTITSLQRFDSGLYSCLFTCHNSTKWQQYSLDVFYPPNLRHCYWTNRDEGGQLEQLDSSSILKCTFVRGNPRGTVMCFKKEGPPQFPELSSGVDTVQTIFRLSKRFPISCCVVSDKIMYSKSFNTCRDFVFPDVPPSSTGALTSPESSTKHYTVTRTPLKAKVYIIAFLICIIVLCLVMVKLCSYLFYRVQLRTLEIKDSKGYMQGNNTIKSVQTAITKSEPDKLQTQSLSPPKGIDETFEIQVEDGITEQKTERNKESHNGVYEVETSFSLESDDNIEAKNIKTHLCVLCKKRVYDTHNARNLLLENESDECECEDYGHY